MRTTQEVKRPVLSEMGKPWLTPLHSWKILWLLVFFLYFVIYFFYNYFKYQRNSEVELYRFRNQISFVTVAIILQETYQKDRPLGYCVLEVSDLQKLQRSFLVFLKVWLCPQAEFMVMSSCVKPGGKLVSHPQPCFSTLMERLCISYDQMESQWTPYVLNPFEQVLGFKGSTWKSIFGVCQ